MAGAGLADLERVPGHRAGLGFDEGATGLQEPGEFIALAELGFEPCQ
jgi:hypothetical protein